MIREQVALCELAEPTVDAKELAATSAESPSVSPGEVKQPNKTELVYMWLVAADLFTKLLAFAQDKQDGPWSTGRCDGLDSPKLTHPHL